MIVNRIVPTARLWMLRARQEATSTTAVGLIARLHASAHVHPEPQVRPVAAAS